MTEPVLQPLPQGNEEIFQKLAGSPQYAGGALVNLSVHFFDRANTFDVSFPVTADDVANPEAWPAMFLDPAALAIVDALKRHNLKKERDDRAE